MLSVHRIKFIGDVARFLQENEYSFWVQPIKVILRENEIIINNDINKDTFIYAFTTQILKCDEAQYSSIKLHVLTLIGESTTTRKMLEYQ
jgi:hypothetical protein